jgi:hypothetical protein
VPPKVINTMRAHVSCDVCGRTLLPGEHADTYIAGGGRRTVCELCTARATHEGWIREGLADRFDQIRNGSARRRSLLARLRHRRDRSGRDGREGAAPAPDDPFAFEPVDGPAFQHASPPPPVAHEAYPTAHAEPRHVRAVPTNTENKLTRALDLFNTSEHPRTVAGVARSLGEPAVAVRPSAEHASIVHAVVAWELSWYRYEIDLANDQSPVQVLARGYELAELDEEERAANACADEHGELHLVTG